MSIQSGYPAAQAQVGSEVDGWLNGANALAGPNGTFSRGSAGSSSTTKQLQLTALGLSVPTDATIKGFRVTSTQKNTGLAGGDLISVGLVSAGAVVGTPKTLIESNTVVHNTVYGGLSDLWASSLTPAQVNAAGFGVAFFMTGNGASVALDLDSVFIEVIYSPAGSTVTGTTPTGGTSTVAYGTNEQVANATGPLKLRVFPTDIQPKTMAAGSGTIAPLTAMTYNTSTNFWGVWATGGANGTGVIQGFMGLDGCVLDASNEILAQIIMSGEIHLSDIPVVGGTLAQLKTALRDSVRKLGFKIHGMEKFY